jgi:hypothetical protein
VLAGSASVEHSDPQAFGWSVGILRGHSGAPQLGAAGPEAESL